MVSAPKLFSQLSEGLSLRQKEVLTGRFGLDKSGKQQTLASLGVKYGVTRERVRQIESSALAEIRAQFATDPVIQDVIAKCQKFLKQSGGITPREALLAYVKNAVDGITENHVHLLLEASRAFFHYPEDKAFHAFYYSDRESLKNATAFINQWASHLRTKRDAILSGGYHDELAAFIKKNGIPFGHAEAYLSVSKRVAVNPYGDAGLAEWPEIQPKTVRDRIYLALKKKGEPLHFRTIAQLINQYSTRPRPASAPTVHNELIKDNRFVLVGRGMYALAEHGYEPGTAREVIHRILKKQGPMKPREVMLAVQKERFFKQNTILVNLQNKNYFKRLDDGKYRTREA